MADLAKILIRINKNTHLLGSEVNNLKGILSDAKKLGDPKLILKIQKQLKATQTAYTKSQIRLRTIKAAADSQKSVPVDIEVSNISGLTTLGIMAVIASAMVTSVVIYKRFFSQAAKACKDKKGTEKSNCMRNYKIAGYNESIKSLKQSLSKCSNTEKPLLCKAKIQDKISAYESKIRKQKIKLGEGKIMVETVIESYLKFLYDPTYQVSKTIRGSNIPIEHDNKINWIRQCMTLESSKMKINCLRKLRDQVVMNPFYQYRIDRFVDAITQTYEPTDEQGTIPGNEFESPELIGESLTLNEQNLLQLFSGSLKTHATIIDWVGFGNWLKAFPKMVKIAHSLAGPKGSATVGAPPVIAGVVMATVILMMARKAWKAYGTIANRKCAKMPDVKKCKDEFKLKIKQQKISELQKAKGFCSKSKDPKKCIAKLDAVINKLK